MYFLSTALAFAGVSAAQSTVSLFIPGADTQPLIASVMGSDASATTYAVQCVPGTDASDCGYAGGFILTAGPSTVAYTLSDGYENGTTSILAFTGYVDCKVTASTAAVCVESYGGDEANFPGMDTTTLEPSEIVYQAVTITDNLPANTDLGTTLAENTAAPSSSAAAAKSVSPASTTTAPTASNTSGGKSTSNGKISSGTVTAQTTGTTSSSTAGAAQALFTGKAQWVVGAAAVGLALI